MPYQVYIQALKDYKNHKINGRRLLAIWENAPSEIDIVYYNLHHLVDDEDIRQKDEYYKTQQLLHLDQLIDVLEKGEKEKGENREYLSRLNFLSFDDSHCKNNSDDKLSKYPLSKHKSPKEILYSQAFSIIQDTQNIDIANHSVFVQFSCHINQHTLAKTAREFGYTVLNIKKHKWTYWLFFIPSPNIISLKIDDLSRFYKFFERCNQFALVEFLLCAKDTDIEHALSRGVDMDCAINTSQNYFYYRLNFDGYDDKDSGESTALLNADYDFVPKNLQPYFTNKALSINPIVNS